MKKTDKRRFNQGPRRPLMYPVHITVKMTEKTRNALAVRAEKDGLSSAAYVRGLIETGLKTK